MRVLVVHNRYSSLVPSGENLSVEGEVAGLRAAGVEVHVHTVSNDDAVGASVGQKLQQASAAVWSGPARREMARVIDAVQPDVVHVHNLFPLLTASVPWAAQRAGVPVVWSVRNQRLTCVDGTHFRDGRPCHSCRPGWRLPGIRHACYRQSLPASTLVTAATSIFGALARRRIPAIAISRSVRDWLTDVARYPADRVRVKYNGIAPPDAADGEVPPAAAQGTILFAAKLAPYKGIDLLLDAWQRASGADCELRIAGSGPLEDEVRAAAAADPRINYLGQVAQADMAEQFRAARVVVVPSTWDEPFGRIAAEALAYGRPVVTTGLGGLGEIVDDTTGWTTGPDAEAMAKALTAAAQDDALVARFSEAAVARHSALFSPDATTAALIGIYDETLRTATTPSR